MGHRWQDGYSADVEIYLLVGDSRIEVAQVMGDSLVLRRHQTLPSETIATLVIVVDGQEDREQILLRTSQGSDSDLVAYF